MQKHALCTWPAYVRHRYITTSTEGRSGYTAKTLRVVTKTIIVMKLTIFLLTTALVQVHATGVSQTVTYSGVNVSLEKIFKDVEKQTGFAFFYDADVLKESKPISIEVNNLTLKDFLDQLFKDQLLSYSIKRKNVIISKVTPAADLSPRLASVVPPVKGAIRDAEGNPLAGVNIIVRGTRQGVVSATDGSFSINGGPGDVLIISYVGYQGREYKLRKDDHINIILEVLKTSLDTAEVLVNTGYQQLPKERATGSFTTISQQLINRSTSTDILSRLQNVTNGVFFNSEATKNGSVTGISIRGQSTLSPFVNRDPLIIVDNFPYEGNINNINPNDISSITILKDAAAASIWGARSGNGVIVITTQKGALNKKMRVEANINFTTSGYPDFGYDKKFIPTSSYLEIEKFLFDKGYYDPILTDKFSYPAVSPVIEWLDQQRSGILDQPTLQGRIDSLQNMDIRQQGKEVFYRRPVAQQYAVNMSGGNQQMSYYLGVGYDHNDHSLTRNDNDRFTITSTNIFTPVKNLELTGSLIYAHSRSRLNNTFGWGGEQSNINRLYPYSSFYLLGGQPASVPVRFRNYYTDSLEQLGFLDWQFRPVEELALADNRSKITSLVLRASAKYTLLRSLSLQVHFQSERQNADGSQYQSENTYGTRTLINQYSQYDFGTGVFNYIFPKGGILRRTAGVQTSNNLRALANYDITKGDHRLSALAGSEIRETIAETSGQTFYGYNHLYGTSVDMIDYTTVYPLHGGGFATVPAPAGGIINTTQRFISYYANAGYTYKSTYTATISARRDGANVFGVRANDRITPLWSAGLGYIISQERFYQSAFLPYLRLRTTYGFNGNVYNGASYLTALYGNVSSVTNLPSGVLRTAPNPELRWERVLNSNVGLDFALKQNILQGSFEYYRKNGRDLVQPIQLAPSSGFIDVATNVASTKTTGMELMLNSSNIDRGLKWNTILILNVNKDQVKKLENKLTAAELASAPFGNLYPGHAIMGMYSYQWRGIDPTNGDPQGVLEKTLSKDYSAIIQHTNPQDLVYHGSARPIIFGSVRNQFSWKGFTLSASVSFKFKYYFRRPTVNLNYQSLLQVSGWHTDYLRRWVKPGDENKSSVPSLAYVTDVPRNEFYRNSAVTIEKGDHIRLADLAWDYILPSSLTSRLSFSQLQVYGFINNLGIIWKANDQGIDPDVITEYMLPQPTAFSIGIRANF